MIERWPDWPAASLALVGPEGSRQEPSRRDLGAGSRRARCCRRARSTTPICRRRSRPARWCSRICAEGAFDERALFHLLNLAREQGAFVLLTARDRAGAAGASALPDLASRLRALPAVALAAPDDALLRAVIVKLFADRQLAVDESLVAYLAHPDRALVRGARAAAVERARPRGAAPQPAGHPGARRRSCSASLDGRR